MLILIVMVGSFSILFCMLRIVKINPLLIASHSSGCKNDFNSYDTHFPFMCITSMICKRLVKVLSTFSASASSSYIRRGSSHNNSCKYSNSIFAGLPPTRVMSSKSKLPLLYAPVVISLNQWNTFVISFHQQTIVFTLQLIVMH